MLTTIENKVEDAVATSNEKENNNLKEITTETTTETDINDQDDYTYSYEQDPSLKSLMNNFDNSVLIDSFQNQCLQFDTERLMNVNPTFFYNDEVFNPENYEITSEELFEKLVKDRTAFMNILLIDLSIYSNFSICGAQIFPNLKQTCIKLKDITDFIEIKKELYNACYLVFEDQWDRKDNSTIVIFDDDGKSQFARAFTEICIEGQWGCNVYMLKDGILSFMKDYPILCVSEEFNEDDEYDDDDDDDDYYYNEGLYKTIQDNNNINEQYTNSIEMVDINENNTYNNEYTDNNQDINTIFNTDNLVNDIAFTTNNSSINDVDMTNISSYQTNDITIDNNIPSINDISISIENDYDMNPSNFNNNVNGIEDNIDVTIEQTDKKRKIEKLDEEKENITKNEEELNSMDYEEESNQINKEEQDQNMIIDVNNNNNNNNNNENNENDNNNNDNTIKTEDSNENIINTSSEVDTENNDISTTVLTENDNNNNNNNSNSNSNSNNNTVINSEIEIEIDNETGNEENNKVSDSMACYDPRQMAIANIDTNNKVLKNNQTEEIIKLRKFQRYLIHNVWYAMDNSNDVPLMVCPPFLYLGSLYTSQEHHLINYNIKHVIRLGTDFNISYTDPSIFNFYNFDIFDLPKEPIKELFQKANEIIEQARLNHENVLVHCHAGVSRSSTIILAYLMRYKGMTLYDAWCSTFKIRPIIRPNDGFAIALQEYEKILFNFDQPTMPVVGMSNSYLFSIEYFDFISRLEEMHKIDPSVPVFRPEKTYDDLLKEVKEEEEAKEMNNSNETSNESTSDDMKEETNNSNENSNESTTDNMKEETNNEEIKINDEKTTITTTTEINENDNSNVNNKKDENQNNELKTEKQESDKSESKNETNKEEFNKKDIKKSYCSNSVDHNNNNNNKLDKNNELKTREE